MTRFFRQRHRVLSALVSPAILWLLLGAGLSGSFVYPGGENAAAGAGAGVGYSEYFFFGAVSMILLFAAVFSTITVIEERREGFLQGVLVAPVPRLAIVLGKVLGGACIAMVHAMVFLLLWPLAMPLPSDVGQWLGVGGAILMMGVLAVGLTGLGLCVAWPMRSTAGFHAIMMLLLMPMWFLSGAVFPAGGASAWMGWLMHLNPMSYGQAAISGLASGGRVETGLVVPVWASAGIAIVITAAAVTGAVALVARPGREGVS